MDCQYLRPTRAEINLDNLEYNFQGIRKITPDSTKICAIVKADAYGHGAVEIAKTVLGSGASYLGVAILDEAMELRKSGIKAPVLILGFTPEDQFDKIVEHNITQTIFSLESAIKLSNEAVKQKKKAKVHIKLDTGMSRIGFPAEEYIIPKIKKLFTLPGLDIEGVFTHFARADERDKSFTEKQLKIYRCMVSFLTQSGFHIPILHVANSAALMEMPHSHFDMVRPGIILYGMYPSQEVSRENLKLKPVMSLKTKIAHIQTLSKGKAISYGGTYVTQRQSTIATLPIGYADGYFRLLSSKGQVLVKGQRAPVVGRICMDQCMIDITDIKGSVIPGEDVVLFGDSGEDRILADDLANIVGTINYEVTCAISRRVPRVYIREGKVEKVKNLLEK